jgi:hypothetical protein
MKKFLVFASVGLLSLALAVTGYAQPKLEFSITGRVDVEGTWGRNNPANDAASGLYAFQSSGPANGGAYIYQNTAGQIAAFGSQKGGALDKGTSWYDSRATLIFNAAMGKEASGTVIFEIDANPWGPGQGATAYSISERNNSGFWTADRSSVEVKNAYLDFAIPAMPIPTTVRAGVQPLAVRPLFFVYTDGPGVSVGLKADPFTINPFWFKAVEGKYWSSDDVDVYGAQLSTRISKFTIGGYGVYYNMDSYPLFKSSSVTLPNGDQVGIASNIPGNSFTANFWWLGLYADGQAGPVNVNFDFLYDYGSVTARANQAIAAAQDVDYKGWRVRGKIDYPWEKFNFGFIGAYGSGADQKDTSTSGLPGSNAGYYANRTNPAAVKTTKVSASVVPPGSESGVMFGESVVFYSAAMMRYTGWSAQLNNFQVHPGGLGGSWFAKLYSSYKPTPDFKVTVQGLYIGDTTKHGNTIGNALEGGGAGGPVPRDDSEIGWEFDLITELQLSKNVKWTTGLGYMLPGDAMDFSRRGPGTASTASFSNTDIDKPWALMTRVQFDW